MGHEHDGLGVDLGVGVDVVVDVDRVRLVDAVGEREALGHDRGEVHEALHPGVDRGPEHLVGAEDVDVP